MRAFVALELPNEQLLGNLVTLQQELARCGADLKLVERNNLHYTVKFLGEISESQASEADRRLRELRLVGGEVTVEGLGAFPSTVHPNIVWVGVAPQDKQFVVHLAETAIGALRGIGEAENRAFEPHLTLARVRTGKNREALSSFIQGNSSRVFGKAPLVEIKLKSSVLTPKGPIYSDVGVYPLK
ncbi:MAG TPA: RNA 2',3'-cyclic phosphodiesterase [Nitrososphaerales archaeon]|nr:RNA 2',3'-cyclic phosphodiesterase [Nitrososphaerales archaeon]